MTNVNDIKVGDILVYDVGYSMILPHFLRVDSVTPSGKSIRVYPIGEDFEATDGGYGQVGYKTPIPEKVIGPRRTIRVGKWGPRIDGHLCRLWNGKPCTYDSMD